MTRWLPAAVLAFGCVSGTALAQAPAGQPLSTGTLVELCAAAPATSEAPATAFCRGFIIGAGQHHHTVANARGVRPGFCMPNPGPSHAEFQAAFVAWARANPQYAQESAVSGLFRFAAATWPCPPATPARAASRAR
jgi:hypothetical protein